MPKKARKGYTAPTELKPFHKKDHSIVHVVIETPKGSKNKYEYVPKLGVYKLSRVLPDGMDFPYDFGFVPSTIGDDGDPIDVLLLMDEPAFAGCMIECRLIGVTQPNLFRLMFLMTKSTTIRRSSKLSPRICRMSRWVIGLG